MTTRDLPYSFTRAQARALGATDRELAAAVRDGTIERCCQGRYRLLLDPHAFEERRSAHLAEAEAALVAHPGGYLLSHVTAAMAYGLAVPLGPFDGVHLSVDTALHRSRRLFGVVIHHSDSVETAVAEAAGLPCTTVSRTLADCLRWHPRTVSVPLADEALRLGLCTYADIENELGTQRRWRGRRRAVEMLGIVDGRRESWLESRAAVSMWKAGVDQPQPQGTVLDDRDRFLGRVDGIWAEDNCVLEVDGQVKYHLPDADGVVDAVARRTAQDVRQAGLEAVGLVVVRTDSAQTHSPEQLAGAVRRARWLGRQKTFRGRLIATPGAGLTRPTAA
jgi:hypothetical protein